MGVDMATYDELIAYNFDIPAIQDRIGADSLAYISLDGMMRAVGAVDPDGTAHGYCNACFTGRYPISVIELRDKLSLEQAFGS